MKWVLLVLLLTGCASMSAQKRLEEYRTMIEPGVGKSTTSEVLVIWGAPLERFQLDTLDVWRYRRVFGARASAVPIGTITQAQAHDSYDEVELIFSRGVLVAWKAYVQR